MEIFLYKDWPLITDIPTVIVHHLLNTILNTASNCLFLVTFNFYVTSCNRPVSKIYVQRCLDVLPLKYLNLRTINYPFKGVYSNLSQFVHLSFNSQKGTILLQGAHVRPISPYKIVA